MTELRRHFRPEFLNRIDEIVLFKPLTLDEIKKIVDLLLGQLRGRLAERRITLNLTDAAREHIGREGYDPVYAPGPSSAISSARWKPAFPANSFPARSPTAPPSPSPIKTAT